MIGSRVSELPKLLEEIEGPEAHQVLVALSKNPELEKLRSGFISAIERHAAKAIEPPAWLPEEVVRFAEMYEKEPSSAEDLFELICSRLEAEKADIEDGDFGDRGLFRAGVAERLIQHYFAGRLERQSRGFYSITREEEVAAAKKPDIRARHPTAGVISIEIKPLDARRYSVAELEKTIENQLVCQYMRAANSKHGILLLCLVAPRQWDLRFPRRRISFAALIDHLNKRANTLVSKYQNLKALRVVGIDMAPIAG